MTSAARYTWIEAAVRTRVTYRIFLTVISTLILAGLLVREVVAG
jgi:hypothetical protein